MCSTLLCNCAAQFIALPATLCDVTGCGKSRRSSQQCQLLANKNCEGSCIFVDFPHLLLCSCCISRWCERENQACLHGLPGAPGKGSSIIQNIDRRSQARRGEPLSLRQRQAADDDGTRCWSRPGGSGEYESESRIPTVLSGC